MGRDHYARGHCRLASGSGVEFEDNINLAEFLSNENRRYAPAMNLTALFIQRPVMTALVMMAILLFGIAGYRSLPVSDLPNIDFPTLQVQASLPGASPETMAASVATILERQFSTVPGLDSMTSLSGRGQTNITLQFVLDRNI